MALLYGRAGALNRQKRRFPARVVLDSLFPVRKHAPKLAGPDLYAQHSFEYTLEEALAGQDQDVVKHLAGMENFATKAGSTLDAFSWHTYDYETPMLGLTDHQVRKTPSWLRSWANFSPL